VSAEPGGHSACLDHVKRVSDDDNDNDNDDSQV